MVGDKEAGKQQGLVVSEEHGKETPSESASVTVAAGTIKWFDVSKGYGFILPENGGPDILLHVTCLRNDGYQTAPEGARVVCEAVCQRTKKTGRCIPPPRILS